MKERTVELGLCKGRHSIQGILDLYVTGLTVATTSLINAVLDHNRTYKNRVILTLYHYNKDTDTYYPQQILG